MGNGVADKIYVNLCEIFVNLYGLTDNCPTLFFPQFLVGQAFDAFQVLQNALEREPCSSINASTVTAKDRDNLLDCMKKVKCFWD